MAEITREEFKELVSEAIEESRKDFHIDAERHYQQHQFLEKLMKFVDQCSTSFWRFFLPILFVGIIAIFVLGICFTGKTKLLG